MESAIEKKYEDITPEDWRKYAWVKTSEFSDMYIRAYKKTQPPNDGYDYQDATALGDAVQVWVRGLKKEDAEDGTN